jgi:hypothetical protein
MNIQGPVLVTATNISTGEINQIRLAEGYWLPQKAGNWTYDTVNWEFHRSRMYKPVKRVIVLDENGKPALNEKGKKVTRPSTDKEKIQSVLDKWINISKLPSTDKFREAYNRTHSRAAVHLRTFSSKLTLYAIASYFKQRAYLAESGGEREAWAGIHLETKRLWDETSKEEP